MWWVFGFVEQSAYTSVAKCGHFATEVWALTDSSVCTWQTERRQLSVSSLLTSVWNAKCESAGSGLDGGAQYGTQLFALGQFVDKFVQVAHVSCKGIFDFLHPAAANRAFDEG